jgi:hypothetical protein
VVAGRPGAESAVHLDRHDAEQPLGDVRGGDDRTLCAAAVEQRVDGERLLVSFWPERWRDRQRPGQPER